MKNQESLKNYAFIDAQNLHQSSKNWGWKLDYAKLRAYLTEKYNVDIAYLFMGYMQEHTETYLNLQKKGFILVFREALEFNGQFYKANCDTDLVLQAMIDYEQYHKAVVISGDGDFVSLIHYLSTHDKLEAVIVPNKSAYSQFLKKASRGRLSYLNIHKSMLQDETYEKTNPSPQSQEGARVVSHGASATRHTQTPSQMRRTIHAQQGVHTAHPTRTIEPHKVIDGRTKKQANLDFIAQFKQQVAKDLSHEGIDTLVSPAAQAKHFIPEEKKPQTVDELISHIFPQSTTVIPSQKHKTPVNSAQTVSSSMTLDEMVESVATPPVISFDDTLDAQTQVNSHVAMSQSSSHLKVNSALVEKLVQKNKTHGMHNHHENDNMTTQSASENTPQKTVKRSRTVRAKKTETIPTNDKSVDTQPVQKKSTTSRVKKTQPQGISEGVGEETESHKKRGRKPKVSPKNA